jgi:predicted transcriptional regulator
MFEYFNGYWDWASNNPNKINPTSTAIYFYILSVANELHWKESFGLSSTQIMNGVNIATYKTYKKHFDELVDSGLVKVIEPSINQYKSNVIALVKFTKAKPKQSIEQGISTDQSTTHNHKTIKDNKEYKEYIEISVEESTLVVPKKKPTKREFLDYKSKRFFKNDEANNLILEFFDHLVEIKRPPTLRSARMIIKRLNKAKCVEQIIESIEKAIAGQYFTIYLEVQRDSYSSNLSFEKNKNGAAASPNTFSRASNGLIIK